MKLRKLLIALLASLTAFSSLFAMACITSDHTGSGDNNSSIGDITGEYISSDWEIMPENTNPNLKYFGYFHSDGFRSQGSYIEEIATLQNSNVVLINSAFSFDVAREKIELARSLNFQVIFSVHGFFTGGQIRVANSASLVENYLEVWQNAQTALNEYVEDGTILAFYFDEPAWNGVKEEDFRTVTKLIRETYPDTKVLTTMTVYDIGVAKYENYPEINASYNEFCTDVSYDSYAKWNDKTRRTYIEALKSKATNNQYIWGCATGFTSNPEQNFELYNAIKGMYTEAIQEPRYAGILPFSYADGFEGDWGYGLHSFLNNTSDYYDRELKQLYVNIGREVCGMPAYDFNSDIEVVLYPFTEVYTIGETIDLPPLGAANGNGEAVPYEVTITSPSGQQIPVGSFEATESGAYVVTVTAGEGANQVVRSTKASVRYPNEISVFDDSAYTMDAGGTDADTWCWPRQVVTDFARTGSGSLRVTPHATDGTWARVIFNRNGYQLWDVSQTGGVSMWAYNNGTETIENLSLMISDEDMNKESTIYETVSMPAGEWVEYSIDISEIRAKISDLTKVVIFFGNSGATYPNRSDFYIDDVMFLEKQDEVVEDGIIDFELPSDALYIGGTEADVWCWPTSISTEQAHSGEHSLKVAPHATDGTWPNVVFKNFGQETFNLTNVESISAWIYFDSDNAMETFAFKITNDGDSNKSEKGFSLPARTWIQVTITKEEITGTTDLTNAYVKIGQVGGTYTDRSNFYIDDFTVVYGEGGSGEVTPDPKPDPEPVIPGGGLYDVPEDAIGFENANDILNIGGSEADVWCWPTSISTEQAHFGTHSLKVAPHATDGTWPNIVIKNGSSETFDLTKIKAICLWVYFDSDKPIRDFGFKICNEGETNRFEKKYDIASRVWTEVYLSIDELASASTDLTNAYVKFSNLGAGYKDRSNFYIDSIYVVLAEEEPEVPEVPADENVIGFESDEDLALVGTNADDIWTWPVSRSAEQAHSGSHSLKVTVRQDGGVWPNVVIGNVAGGTIDMTNVEKVTMWVYFDSDSAQTNFKLKINNGENVNQMLKGITLAAREWTQISISKAEILAGAAQIDLTKVRICIAQCAGTYEDRSNFYVDDFQAKQSKNKLTTERLRY